jgi:hypothetical protein
LLAIGWTFEGLIGGIWREVVGWGDLGAGIAAVVVDRMAFVRNLRGETAMNARMIGWIAHEWGGPQRGAAMPAVSGRRDAHARPIRDTSPRYRSEGPPISRAFLGGMVGTVAITLMMYKVDPLITGRTMDLARMLGTMIGNPHGAGGMVLHVFNGVILFPMGFAFLSARLPGISVVKGLIWGVILWALAQALVMPMMGSGFFGDTADGLRAALSSLAGHLVYGGFQGLIAGSGDETSARPCRGNGEDTSSPN